MFPTPTLLVPALYCTYCSLLFQLLSVEISTVENRPQTGGYAIQQYTPPSQISQYVPHNRQISQFGDAIYMMPGKRYHVPCKRRERYSSTRYPHRRGRARLPLPRTTIKIPEVQNTKILRQVQQVHMIPVLLYQVRNTRCLRPV